MAKAKGNTPVQPPPDEVGDELDETQGTEEPVTLRAVRDCYCNGMFYQKGATATFRPGELIPEHFQ